MIFTFPLHPRSLQEDRDRLLGCTYRLMVSFHHFIYYYHADEPVLSVIDDAPEGVLNPITR